MHNGGTVTRFVGNAAGPADRIEMIAALPSRCFSESGRPPLPASIASERATQSRKPSIANRRLRSRHRSPTHGQSRAMAAEATPPLRRSQIDHIEAAEFQKRSNPKPPGETKTDGSLAQSVRAAMVSEPRHWKFLGEMRLEPVLRWHHDSRWSDAMM